MTLPLVQVATSTVGAALTSAGTTLIVPAVATYRYSANRQLAIGYALALGSYVAGLAASVVTDLPSSPVIVWAMAVIGLLIHLAVGREVRVATLLKQKNVKVVFAESCTAGLVAESLARVQGISEHHCGGMVFYRN